MSNEPKGEIQPEKMKRLLFYVVSKPLRITQHYVNVWRGRALGSLYLTVKVSLYEFFKVSKKGVESTG